MRLRRTRSGGVVPSLMLELPVRVAALPLGAIGMVPFVVQFVVLALLDALGLKRTRALADAAYADLPLDAITARRDAWLGSESDFDQMTHRDLRRWYARLLVASWLAISVAVLAGLMLHRVWPSVLALLAAGGALASPLVTAGKSLRSRARARRRFEIRPEPFFDARDHAIVLTRDLRRYPRPCSWQWCKELVEEFPVPKRVVDFDLEPGDAPDSSYERLRANADLIVLRCETGRPGLAASRLESLVKRLERGAPNPFRRYVVVVDGDAEVRPLRAAWRDASPQLQVSLEFVACEFSSIRSDQAMNLLGGVAAARARRAAVRDVATLERCITELHPACIGLLRDALSSTAHVETTHALLDFWEAWLRLFWQTLAALEGGPAAGSENDRRTGAGLAELLRFLGDLRPATPAAAVLHGWLHEPYWDASQVALRGIAVKELEVPADPELKISPAALIETVRKVRNRLRHGVLAHHVSEAVWPALLADFLALHASHQARFGWRVEPFGRQPRITVTVPVVGDVDVLLPGVRFGESGWEYASNHGSWRPFRRTGDNDVEMGA